MPSAITSSAPGSFGRRASSASASSDTPPNATALQCHCGSCASNCQATAGAASAVGWVPVRLDNCLTMITSASPNENPRSTGLEMKLQIEPSRIAPATRNARPVASTRAAASAARRMASCPASDKVAAPSTAADDDVADTIAKRERPIRP